MRPSKGSQPIFFNRGLNEDGSEIVDTTKLILPLINGGQMSADQKLKQMLDRELAKHHDPDETQLDDYDFNLPDDSPQVHHSVRMNPSTKEEILEQVKLKKQKQTDDKDPVVRKSAKPDRAQRVEHDKNNSTTSASEAPTEGADEKEE